MIAETHMREIAQRIVSLLEYLQVGTRSDAESVSGSDTIDAYYRGCLSTREHDLQIVRLELAEYLPETCGCGQPSIGRDITPSPICAGCSALAIQAIEETGLSPAGMIPPQRPGGTR